MDPLQSFDVGSSSYERPTQRWVCGHAADGHPCHAGPNRRGHCGATFECVPVRTGDRWDCTRSTQAGGRCASGPQADGTCCRPVLPCVPVRSLRIRRGRTAAMLVIIVLGFLAVFAGGARSRWLIEPGPLALKHAAIANCDSCHGHIGEGPMAWLHAAMTKVDSGEGPGRCLACHSLGDHPLATHGRPPEDLTAATERIHAEAMRVQAVFGVTSPAATEPHSRSIPDLACTESMIPESSATSRPERCQRSEIRFAAIRNSHAANGIPRHSKRFRFASAW